MPEYSQLLRVHTITNEECESRTLDSIRHRIYNGTLCVVANSSSMCNGDSGSALVWKGRLVGAVSWANLCTPGLPFGFTRISNFIDWITSWTGIAVE